MERKFLGTSVGATLLNCLIKGFLHAKVSHEYVFLEGPSYLDIFLQPEQLVRTTRALLKL